jgi:uncharacterized protein YjlB
MSNLTQLFWISGIWVGLVFLYYRYVFGTLEILWIFHGLALW